MSHHDALRTLLQREPYGLLLCHAAVQLGPAVLLTQREMLQVRGCRRPSPHQCWHAARLT